MSGETIGPPDVAVLAARVVADFLAALAMPALEVNANNMAKVIDAMVVVRWEVDNDARRSLWLEFLFSLTPLVDIDTGIDLALIEFDGTYCNEGAPNIMLDNGRVLERMGVVCRDVHPPPWSPTPLMLNASTIAGMEALARRRRHRHKLSSRHHGREEQVGVVNCVIDEYSTLFRCRWEGCN